METGIGGKIGECHAPGSVSGSQKKSPTSSSRFSRPLEKNNHGIPGEAEILRVPKAFQFVKDDVLLCGFDNKEVSPNAFSPLGLLIPPFFGRGRRLVLGSTHNPAWPEPATSFPWKEGPSPPRRPYDRGKGIVLANGN